MFLLTMLRSAKRSRKVSSITVSPLAFFPCFLPHRHRSCCFALGLSYSMTGFLVLLKQIELSPVELNLIYFGTRHGNNSISYAYCLYSCGTQSHVKAFGGAGRHEYKQ